MCSLVATIHPIGNKFNWLIAAGRKRRTTDALLNIINDMPEYPKVEAEKFESEVIAFDMRKSIEDDLGVVVLKTITHGKLSYHW